MVNIDNLLDNFDGTLERVRLIKQRMGQQKSERKRFQWSQPLLEEFAVVASREGISDVKPSQLEEYFPQLQNSQLGSHLQKYKLKIMRDFGLKSFQQIENWMCPKEFCKSPRVIQALKNWGYHDSENIAADTPSEDKKE